MAEPPDTSHAGANPAKPATLQSPLVPGLIQDSDTSPDIPGSITINSDSPLRSGIERVATLFVRHQSDGLFDIVLEFQRGKEDSAYDSSAQYVWQAGSLVTIHALKAIPMRVDTILLLRKIFADGSSIPKPDKLAAEEDTQDEFGVDHALEMCVAANTTLNLSFDGVRGRIELTSPFFDTISEALSEEDVGWLFLGNP